MILPVTLTIAAAAALLNFWLAVRISRIRIRDRITIGDGGVALMTARMRAHANFVEYAPFVLILLAAIELAGGSARWLWVAGTLWALSRIAHALGMDRPAPNPWRGGGAFVTLLVMLLLGLWALAIAYGVGAGVPGNVMEVGAARA